MPRRISLTAEQRAMRERIDSLKKILNAALESLGDEYDLRLRAGNISYDYENGFSFKVTGIFADLTPPVVQDQQTINVGLAKRSSKVWYRPDISSDWFQVTILDIRNRGKYYIAQYDGYEDKINVAFARDGECALKVALPAGAKQSAEQIAQLS